MKKFLRIFGIIAFVALIGFSFASCEDDSDSGFIYQMTFQNSSSQTVTISSNDLDPSNITLAPGQSRQVRSRLQIAQYLFGPANLVAPTQVVAGTVVFVDI
ncbi:MAG: hypothetical protein FWG77_03555 [Treponema sp.]|nr:hypothetical protein [Treponema sp.]